MVQLHQKRRSVPGEPLAEVSRENALPIEVPGTVTVTGLVKTVLCVPTLTVAANYALNDYVGTSGVAWEFKDAVRPGKQSGIIQFAELFDGVVASVAAELWLFDAPIVPPADSAAWTLNDADMRAHIIPGSPILFSTYYASAANSIAPAGPLAIPFTLPEGITSIFGALVTRGAPAYAATGDVAAKLVIMLD